MEAGDGSQLGKGEISLERRKTTQRTERDRLGTLGVQRSPTNRNDTAKVKASIFMAKFFLYTRGQDYIYMCVCVYIYIYVYVYMLSLIHI